MTFWDVASQESTVPELSFLDTLKLSHLRGLVVEAMLDAIKGLSTEQDIKDMLLYVCGGDEEIANKNFRRSLDKLASRN